MSGISEVAELVRRETGIVMPESRAPALRLALRRAAPALDAAAFLREVADPVRGPALVERLVDEVTTQETTFARDRQQLDAIDWHVLLRQAQAAGDAVIRIWSAGCATGEEAYTLAILAAEAFGSASAPVDILGTDISAAALAAARSGKYRPKAVRNLPRVLRRRYFTSSGDGGYQISERLRRLVRYRRHNLIRAPIPPPGEPLFDLIVCRNVLIYFEPPIARQLISAFEHATRPGGSLLLGAVDVLCREGMPLAAPSAPAAPSVPAAPSAATAAPASPAPPALARARPPGPREERLAAAIAAADRGDPEEAQAQVAPLLADDPLDAEAHFIRGMVKLSSGDPSGAADELRGALYSDSSFSLAAFELGRAYDLLGDTAAAKRAYQRALRTLDPDDGRHEFMLQQIDIGDIAAACRARLGGKP